MKVTLKNNSVRLELTPKEVQEFGAYLIMLLQSNKVTGHEYHDDIHNTTVITGYGTNENIYCALMQIQEESMPEYYTINDCAL